MRKKSGPSRAAFFSSSPLSKSTLSRSVRRLASRIAQDEAAAERYGSDRQTEMLGLCRFFESAFRPSFVHTCRATPRRPPHSTTPLASHSAMPALNGQRPTSFERVRSIGSKAIDGGALVCPWWHSQALSKMKNRSLPGDRQGGDLVPVCPLADAAQQCPFTFR
jgi:hypothetical protein